MEIVITFIKGIHIIVSILLIITVLLQPGKGGDLGSMFGGTTESIFGASGAVPFLTKVTRVLAVLFMITSLSLGYFSTRGVKSSVVKESAPVSVEEKSTTSPLEQQPSDVSSTNPEKRQEPNLTKEPGNGQESRPTNEEQGSK
ncbi:MAG: preprotein translocase subunit SecG [Thermodesulfobacteriota bacterium]